jgi:hypothetical protein
MDVAAVALVRRIFGPVVAVLVMIPAVAWGGDAARRTFWFTYGGTVTGVKPGETARVWLPLARTDRDQVVEIVRREMPGHPRTNSDARNENQFLYFETAAGMEGGIRFSVVYRVTRSEVAEETAGGDGSDWRYLRADMLVPVGGKPARVLLAGKTMPADPLRRGRVLYDLVDDHMEYRKDKPGWGRGDAAWACDSGFGNCTDFHSLFISLARSLEIPAKFEMGFAIPVGRGTGEVAGYHCWAKFRPAGHGWVPVDISEANKDPSKRDYYFGTLDENRVMFSTGRDLQLAPGQAGPPVNFLVYPYVEVDGKPYPQEKIKCAFAYEDVGPAAKTR